MKNLCGTYIWICLCESPKEARERSWVVIKLAMGIWPARTLPRTEAALPAIFLENDILTEEKICYKSSARC